MLHVRLSALQYGSRKSLIFPQPQRICDVMSLTADQRKRYSRQIALAEIGEAGQEVLLDSSIVMIGAGGLGSPVLQTLAASGIGRIGVVDGDRVELSNLHRQTLFRNEDIGHVKAEKAAAVLLQINPDITVDAHPFRLDADNAEKLIAPYDLVIDGCDNFPTRFLVNEMCVKLKRPLISGAVSEWAGQVAVFKAYEKNQPCYQCFCPEIPPRDGQPDCSAGGVLGALTGIIGNLVAMQAIRQLLEIGADEAGNLIRYDARTSKFAKGKIGKDGACGVCA